LLNLRRALALCAAALISAGLAGPAGAVATKPGGTLNVDLSSDVDSTDPALAYLNTSWEIMYATCLKLLNYPDAEAPRGSTLTPEAAAGFPRVSNGGRTYDFVVRAGFTRFSNGRPVTARSFAHALERVASPKMQSPGLTFISDVVGAKAVADGKASAIRGVEVKGDHLLVTLEKPAPDFLSRIAMSFFCAVPAGLPASEQGELTPPSAGPYYVASRKPGSSIVLKRNPYYHGTRPHNASQIVYTVGNAQEASYLRVAKGESDYAAGGVPATAYAELASRYGINKGRFFVRPVLGIQYFALNTQRPIFEDNLPLRRAVNFAIDRHAMLIQGGYLSGKRSDQILPPGMAGFRNASLYPIQGPNFAEARRLAKGHTRGGKVVFYTSNRGANPAIAQILEYDLAQIGLDVETQMFPTAVQLSKMGTAGEPFDIGSHTWAADYNDPYDFVNVLLDGRNIRDAGNVNFSYFDDPSFERKMRQASLLSGSSRSRAYAKLDADIMWNASPWVVRANMNSRTFVSKRFGCFVYNPTYGVDLAAACVEE
jgi:ABC-type transport system substrate-binding protein